MRLALTFIVALLMAGTAMAVSTAPANATAANRTQAVRKAKEYLAYEAFSLKSLIHQLKYEGFSTSDATYGASHAGANWMKQAVKKAKEYLAYEAFSFSGLVHQLEYEGFTHAQAVHGAHGAGL